MRAEEILAELLRADVHLWIEGDRLRYRASKGALTATLRTEIAQQKEEIIALLQSRDFAYNSTLPQIVPSKQRYQSFPLNDIQQAYWLGRGGTFEVGNVSTHLYLEIDCTDLKLEQLNSALQRLIARHDMLRAIVLADGQQQVLESVPAYQIQLDLRSRDPQETASQLEAIRQRMSHQVLVLDQWPLFEIRATQVETHRIRLHFSIDGLIADGRSIFLLFQEWAEYYHQPEAAPTPINLSFRDYVLAGDCSARNGNCSKRSRLLARPFTDPTSSAGTTSSKKSPAL